MKNFPLLPPLKDDGAGLAVLPRTGTWEEVPDVALNNIAENLNVIKVDGKYIDIDSIPSMWARPLLFEIALYDTNHPMHECVVGEWRGLLAMLALKEQRKFPLKTKLITIPDGDDGGTPELLQALHRLLPQRTLDDAGTTWDKLYLILFKNNPIGITSPTTLVCTSIDYIKHITVNDVRWYDPPFLCDPILHLNDGEKTSVAGWLNDFHTKTIIPLPASPIKRNLAPRILDFIRGLGGAPDRQPKLADTPLQMNVGIFTGMNFPIAPKEYFTEKLFVIPRSDAFLEQNVLLPIGSDTLKDVNGNSVTPILPIAKELLKELLNDFSVNELRQRITLQTTPVGIKVDLKLPASGGGPDDTFSRVYVNQKDDDAAIFDRHEIIEIDSLPVLEIWPDFAMPDWEAYYTYFRKPGPNTFYAEPFYEKNDVLDSHSLVENIGDIEAKIIRTSDFPKAMICTYKDTQTSKSEDAGGLFISVQEQPQDGTTWNISIDFGTSGTTVYRHDPTQASPAPMTFDDRLLQVTQASVANRTFVYQHFFSSRREETPFFTLFQQHLHSREKSGAGIRLEPLQDGRIYFVEDYRLKENVVSNLKWSSDPEDRIRTQAFLEQICIQCAAEAMHSGVKQINWNFSYPLAFSKTAKTDFNTICTNATTVCKKITGIQTGTVNFESESVATAKFFANEFGGFANGAVCIDIGGETSDISIWQDNKLCWQTSIRLAGRSIFLDLIRHDPEFLKRFGVIDEDIRMLKESNEFYSQADTWINAWLNKAEQKLPDKFAIYGGQIHSTPFVPLIALGTSGLFYYVGLLLRYLVDEKRFKPTMPDVYIGGNGSRILDWLANGDFEQNSESEEHLKKMILTASGLNQDAIFDLKITPNPKHEAAAGLVGNGPNLKLTEDQFGVLAGEVFTENGKGENNKEDCSWAVLLKAESFGAGLKSRSELARTENFINTFNAGFGKVFDAPINFDLKLKRELTRALNDWFGKLAEQPDGARVVEPIFIKVLEKLLELERKSKQWN